MPRLREVLGPLAGPIIEIVAARGEATVGDVVADLAGQSSRPHAYTTVMTIMGRLHERGLLARQKVDRRYVYRPTSGEADLLDQLSGAAVDRVLERYGSAALRHFALKVADLDPDLRQRLITLASRK